MSKNANKNEVEQSVPSRIEQLKALLAEVSEEELSQVQNELKEKALEASKAEKLEAHKAEVQNWAAEFAAWTQESLCDGSWTSKDVRTEVRKQLKTLPGTKTSSTNTGEKTGEKKNTKIAFVLNAISSAKDGISGEELATKYVAKYGPNDKSLQSRLRVLRKHNKIQSIDDVYYSVAV